jgi:hypothetical protein
MRHVLKLDDPGVAPLLLSLRERFPATQVAFPVVDHGCVPVERVQLAAVPADVAVVRIVPGATAAVEAFYATLLVPVELELLALPAARTVFAAVVRGRILGACVVSGALEGFGADVIEHLRVDPELAAPDYATVWNGLARAAVCEVARRSDLVVSALHPQDRGHAVNAGLLTVPPEQCVVISATERGDIALEVARHASALLAAA